MVSSTQGNSRFLVVFDIDRVIARPSTNAEYDIFYTNNGAIIPETLLEDGSVFSKHYIYPGVIGFFKVLSSIPSTDFCFYSAGDKGRNTHLIQELFKRCFEDAYLEALNKIRIFSREDMVGGKKNLQVVLQDKYALENTLIVDDRLEVIADGQENHHIQPKRPSYTKLKGRPKVHQDNGLRKISCVIAKNTCSERHFSKYIVAFPMGEEFYVSFQTHSGEVKEAKIVNDQLTRQLQTVESIPYYFVVPDDSTKELLRQEVAQNNGKIEKLCRAANQIYWVAGLLLNVIRLATENNQSLVEVLNNQYRELDKETPFNINVARWRAWKLDSIYLQGLKAIQSITPAAELITEKHFL